MDTPTHIQEIVENGYSVLPQVFSPQQMKQALELVSYCFEKSPSGQSKDVPFLNRGQPMVYNLQNKNYFFLELLFSATQCQDILTHFLNDPWYRQIPEGEPNYILRSYLARSSQGALPLHIDSFIPYPGGFPLAMQFVIVLEDMGRENGCTLVVPGSHKQGEYATQEAARDAIPVEASCGDIVLWDSRLWHGALANESDRTRWAMIATFVRWWVKQAFKIPENLPQHIYEKLTPNQKAMLGFCAIPFNSEREGIDMKQGYDALPESVERPLATNSY